MPVSNYNNMKDRVEHAGETVKQYAPAVFMDI